MKRFLQLAALVLVLSLSWRFFVSVTRGETASDFATFIIASKRLYAGQDIYLHEYNDELSNHIYNGAPPAEVWFKLHYLYTPFLAVALGPINDIPHKASQYLFSIINWATTLGVAGLLAILTKHSLVGRFDGFSRWIAILYLVVVFDPFYVTFAEGQVNIITLFLILTFILLWEKPAFSTLSGLFLSLAMLLKMTPAILIAGPIRAKKIGIVAGFVFTAAALSLALYYSPIPRSGYENFIHQFWELIGGKMEEVTLNMSFQRVVLALTGLTHSSAGRVIFKATLLIIFGCGALAMRPSAAHYPLSVTSFLMLGMILASPITWSHHLVLLVIPLSSLLMRAWPDQPAEYRRLTVFFGFVLFFSKVYIIQHYVIHEAPRLLAAFYGAVNGTIAYLAILVFLDHRAELRNRGEKAIPFEKAPDTLQ